MRRATGVCSGWTSEREEPGEGIAVDLTIRARLSAMMFLQYFVWGAWFVPFATYLTHHGLQDSVGTIYSAQGWAAIAAPLFVGAIADRYFSAEKVMGILHLFAGGLLFLLSS